MSRVKTVSDIAEISGKTLRNEPVYYRTNHHTGKTQRVHYNRDGMRSRPCSERQRTVRQAYLQLNREATQWYHSIKPTADHPGDPQQWQALMQAFDAQHHIGNPYIFAIKYYNNNIKTNE